MLFCQIGLHVNCCIVLIYKWPASQMEQIELCRVCLQVCWRRPACASQRCFWFLLLDIVCMPKSTDDSVKTRYIIKMPPRRGVWQGLGLNPFSPCQLLFLSLFFFSWQCQYKTTRFDMKIKEMITHSIQSKMNYYFLPACLKEKHKDRFERI